MSEQQIFSVPIAQPEVKSEAPLTQPGATPPVKKPRRNRKNRMAKKASSTPTSATDESKQLPTTTTSKSSETKELDNKFQVDSLKRGKIMKPALKMLKDLDHLTIDGSVKQSSTAIWLANTLVRLGYAQI